MTDYETARLEAAAKAAYYELIGPFDPEYDTGYAWPNSKFYYDANDFRRCAKAALAAADAVERSAQTDHIANAGNMVPDNKHKLLEDAIDTLCNAMAETYPLGCPDFERYKSEINLLINAAQSYVAVKTVVERDVDIRAQAIDETLEQAAQFVEDSFDFIGGELEIAIRLRALKTPENQNDKH